MRNLWWDIYLLVSQIPSEYRDVKDTEKDAAAKSLHDSRACFRNTTRYSDCTCTRTRLQITVHVQNAPCCAVRFWSREAFFAVSHDEGEQGIKDSLL